MIKVRVFITSKAGIIDPAGKAIKLGLLNLGYNDINQVNCGKIIDIEFNHDDAEKAKIETKEMCEKLLANPNMENYTFEILEREATV